MSSYAPYVSSLCVERTRLIKYRDLINYTTDQWEVHSATMYFTWYRSDWTMHFNIVRNVPVGTFFVIHLYLPVYIVSLVSLSKHSKHYDGQKPLQLNIQTIVYQDSTYYWSLALHFSINTIAYGYYFLYFTTGLLNYFISDQNTLTGQYNNIYIFW